MSSAALFCRRRSFDHLISLGEDKRRNGQSEVLSGMWLEFALAQSSAA